MVPPTEKLIDLSKSDLTLIRWILFIINKNIIDCSVCANAQYTMCSFYHLNYGSDKYAKLCATVFNLLCPLKFGQGTLCPCNIVHFPTNVWTIWVLNDHSYIALTNTRIDSITMVGG